MINNDIKYILYSVGSILFILFSVCFFMWVSPKYNVYKYRMEGQAILAHAQSSRDVAVAEAKAKMESARLLAEADILRAKGAAKANKIIGNSLKNNEAYLKYLWIQNIEHTQGQIIYVPTETNLPILEASRHNLVISK